jgi:hypothetical protein
MWKSKDWQSLSLFYNFSNSYLSKYQHLCLSRVTDSPLSTSVLYLRNLTASLESLWVARAEDQQLVFSVWGQRILALQCLQDIESKTIGTALKFNSNAGFVSLERHWKRSYIWVDRVQFPFYSWKPN